MNAPAKIYQLPVKKQEAPRVNSWRWNELEDEALDSLPPEIERLYMRGLRKHMDYATGVVGRKRRVCNEGFMELLEYIPPKGSREKARYYSRQQIGRMLDKLEEIGLIVRLHRGKGVKANMEFYLPLACSDEEQQRARSEHVGESNQNPHGYHSDEGNTEQGAGTDERATSGSPLNNSSLRSELTSKKSKPKFRFEEIDMQLAELLAGNVDRLAGEAGKHNLKSWANTIRLMRESDGHTAEQIKYLINWVAADDFWSGNVLSPAKLRQKWQQLKIRVQQQKKPPKPRCTPGMHTGLSDFSNIETREDGTVDF